MKDLKKTKRIDVFVDLSVFSDLPALSIRLSDLFVHIIS